MQVQVKPAMDVSVFKTNVQEPAEAARLIALLKAYYPGAAINFDLEDCDKILRIAHGVPDATVITSLLSSAGYLCEEL